MIPRPRFVVKVTARFGRTGRDGAIGDDETIRVRVFPRRVRIQGAHIARRRRLETGVASACPSRPSRPRPARVSHRRAPARALGLPLSPAHLRAISCILSHLIISLSLSLTLSTSGRDASCGVSPTS